MIHKIENTGEKTSCVFRYLFFVENTNYDKSDVKSNICPSNNSKPTLLYGSLFGIWRI